MLATTFEFLYFGAYVVAQTVGVNSTIVARLERFQSDPTTELRESCVSDL